MFYAVMMDNEGFNYFRFAVFDNPLYLGFSKDINVCKEFINQFDNPNKFVISRISKETKNVLKIEHSTFNKIKRYGDLLLTDYMYELLRVVIRSSVEDWRDSVKSMKKFFGERETVGVENEVEGLIEYSSKYEYDTLKKAAEVCGIFNLEADLNE